TDGPGRVLGVANDRDVQVDGLRVRYCHKRLRHSVSPALLGVLPSYVQWANVVHLTAVYSFPTFPPLFFCRLFNKPVVWSPRGALQRWEGSSRVVHKWVWESICHTLAPKNNLVLHVTSQAEAEQSLRRFPKLRAVVIRNGVDVPQNLKRSASNGKFDFCIWDVCTLSRASKPCLRLVVSLEGNRQTGICILRVRDPHFMSIFSSQRCRISGYPKGWNLSERYSRSKRRRFSHNLM